MCKLAIDIGTSNTHIAFSVSQQTHFLEDREMSVCVLENGVILWEKEADMHSYDPGAEYIRWPLDTMNRQESFNGRTYLDIFVDFFEKIKNALPEHHRPLSHITIITPQNLSQMDDRYTIFFDAVRSVFPSIELKFTSIGLAAAKQYRTQSRHAGREDIMLIDMGTYRTTIHLIRYNDNGQCIAQFNNTACNGANIILESMYQSLCAQENIVTPPTESDWENMRQAIIALSQQERTTISLHGTHITYTSAQLATHYAPCVAMLAREVKQMIELHQVNIQTIVLIGGNFTSEILRQSLSNQLYVQLQKPILLYASHWDYSKSAVLGALQSDRMPIGSVVFGGKEQLLKEGDNYFDTQASAGHFFIRVVPQGNNYTYTLFAGKGSVIVGTIALDSDTCHPWLPDHIFLNQSMRKWRAAGMDYELNI